MMGRDKLFVCWLEAAPTVVVEQTGNTSCAPQMVDDSTRKPRLGKSRRSAHARKDHAPRLHELVFAA